MKIRTWAKLFVALGMTSCLAGCKTPLASYFGSGTSVASTSPEVKYKNLSPEFTATAKKNANTKTISGVQPSENVFTKAWKTTTAPLTAAMASKKGSTANSTDAVSLNNPPGKMSADLHIATARVHTSKQQFAQAQAQYEQALKAEPKNLTAMLEMARLSDQQNQSQQAIDTYQKAQRIHPKSGAVCNDLGLCYANRRELQKSLQMHRKAVELEPGNARYRANCADRLVEAGQTSEAYALLAAIYPEAVAHSGLANLLAGRGRKEEAVAHLRTALSLDPTQQDALTMLAQLEAAGQDISNPQDGQQPISRPVSFGEGAEPAQEIRQDQRANRAQYELPPGGTERSGAPLYQRMSHSEELPQAQARNRYTEEAQTSKRRVTRTLTDDEPADDVAVAPVSAVTRSSTSGPAKMRITDDESPVASAPPVVVTEIESGDQESSKPRLLNQP